MVPLCMNRTVPIPSSSPRRRLAATALALAWIVTGCTVGPDYHRPDIAVPTAYRENPPTTGDWKTARRIDKIEWFASAEDLCRAMAALWTRAQTPQGKPLLDVLAAR